MPSPYRPSGQQTLAQQCPRCKAPKGKQCAGTVPGSFRSMAHPERSRVASEAIVAARNVAAAEPVTKLPNGTTITTLDVECSHPFCNALPGERCRKSNQKYAQFAHAVRVSLAASRSKQAPNVPRIEMKDLHNKSFAAFESYVASESTDNLRMRLHQAKGREASTIRTELVRRDNEVHHGKLHT